MDLLDIALSREWLQTNGLGGFASSTIAGLNTRRYHGLLIAATKPPVGRMLLLSKLEETLVVDGRRHDLSANRYPGVIHPQGHLLLKEFRHDPFPVSVYAVEGLELEKSVFMVAGENTTVIQYRLRAPAGPPPAACTLELRPLIAFRDYHATTHQNDALDPRFEMDAGWVRLTPYAGLPSLYLNHSGADLQPADFWYRNFEYERERERGLDFREDLFNPLVLTFDLNRDASVSVAASTERRPALVPPPAPPNAPIAPLARAAHQFIVQRGAQSTVIAGYHWFGDWGRDTMIALPGLTLATGRADVARQILLAFAEYVDGGMLPNNFPDAGGKPQYNSVDAALWFFEAVRQYFAATKDGRTLLQLFPTLGEMIDAHVKGTRYNIQVDPADGLLCAGEPGVQLTWMDAKVGDSVVTPRTGKAIEVNALWINALETMAEFARLLARPGGGYEKLSAKAQKNFQKFWNEERGCCFDVIDVPGGGNDAALRPNQLFGVSLPVSPLTEEQQKSVVDVCAQHLLTSYGLRSLAPGEPGYRGHYMGGPKDRDVAYHQGTVWGWLLGPFVLAHLRVYGDRAEAMRFLEPLGISVHMYGLGTLGEIFEGEAPFTPHGAIAQAWTVGEVLRAMREIQNHRD